MLLVTKKQSGVYVLPVTCN